MSSSRRRLRSLGFALGGACAFLAAWAALKSQFLAGVEHLSYDLRVAAASPPGTDERIVHVNIDDASVRPEALGRWPWHRDVHARMVDLLTELGAEAIVFDVEFVEPQAPYLDPDRAEEVARSLELVVGREDALVPHIRALLARARKLLDEGRPDDADHVLVQLREDLAPYEAMLRLRFEGLVVRPDEELADAIRRSGRVVLPVHFKRGAATNPPPGRLRDSSWAVPEPDPHPISRDAIESPVPAFAAGAAGFGAVDVPPADSDRILRRVPPLHRHGGRVYAQLGLKVALDRTGSNWSLETRERSILFRGASGSFELPVDEQGALLVDWVKGPWDRLFRQYAYADVVQTARDARQIDVWFAKLTALLWILEPGPLPAWPPGGGGAYLKSSTWEAQDRTLRELEPLLAASKPDDATRLEARDEARSIVAAIRRVQQRRAEKHAPIREAFRGKIVFIGSTETSGTDLKATSTHPALPGVFFHSTVANMVFRRRFVEPLPRRAALFVVLGAALAATAIASFGRPAVTGPLIVLLVGGYVGAAFVAFSSSRLVLPVVAPVLASVVPYVVVLAWRLATEDRERRLVRSIFTHYLSPKLVDRLIDDPAKAGLGGERREISVLFSDVHGFTAFAENNPSEAVVRTLNEYLQAITDVILRNGGYLDKYLGDGIMAVFGIFEASPAAAAAQACRTALEAQEKLREFGRGQEGVRHPLGETRFGIASGSAVVGNIGTREKLNYTAIGDAVNVAARLQVLNKKTGTRILIDEPTRRLAAAQIQARPLGPHAVEGREKAVEVFELTGPAGDGNR
ncbi:MAG: adenylate/guanylate cyclase domain-containing protein [Planctomycetes bacterium]|nr:adenylate/guanylate cyclase domain-containing protein [Planctomycetota bacterium]